MDNLNDKLPFEYETQPSCLGDVSGSLPSDEEIREGADNWVFEINGMKWSNNDDTAGDNFSSFIAGAKWLMQRIRNDR